MRILFMGTPDIAAASLAAILQAGHEVCGVFTRQDKPVGRKQVLTAPPVKQLAESRGIPVFQPRTLREETVQADIRALAPELIVVVAYGRILPPEVLEVPPFGCINLHVSLLPKYRGAAPVQWAVINGDEKTGVSIMYLDEGLDTGDILQVAPVDIGPEETSGELFGRITALGAKTLVETIAAIENHSLLPELSHVVRDTREQDSAFWGYHRHNAMPYAVPQIARIAVGTVLGYLKPKPQYPFSYCLLRNIEKRTADHAIIAADTAKRIERSGGKKAHNDRFRLIIHMMGSKYAVKAIVPGIGAENTIPQLPRSCLDAYIPLFRQPFDITFRNPLYDERNTKQGSIMGIDCLLAFQLGAAAYAMVHIQCSRSPRCNQREKRHKEK